MTTVSIESQGWAQSVNNQSLLPSLLFRSKNNPASAALLNARIEIELLRKPPPGYLFYGSAQFPLRASMPDPSQPSVAIVPLPDGQMWAILPRKLNPSWVLYTDNLFKAIACAVASNKFKGAPTFFVYGNSASQSTMLIYNLELSRFYVVTGFDPESYEPKTMMPSISSFQALFGFALEQSGLAAQSHAPGMEYLLQLITSSIKSNSFEPMGPLEEHHRLFRLVQQLRRIRSFFETLLDSQDYVGRKNALNSIEGLLKFLDQTRSIREGAPYDPHIVFPEFRELHSQYIKSLMFLAKDQLSRFEELYGFVVSASLEKTILKASQKILRKDISSLEILQILEDKPISSLPESNLEKQWNFYYVCQFLLAFRSLKFIFFELHLLQKLNGTVQQSWAKPENLDFFVKNLAPGRQKDLLENQVLIEDAREMLDFRAVFRGLPR